MSALAPIGRVHVLTRFGGREVWCYARANGLAVTESVDARGRFHVTFEGTGNAVSSGDTDAQRRGLPQEEAVTLMYQLADMAPWRLMNAKELMAFVCSEKWQAVRAACEAAYTRAAAEEGGAT